MRVEFEPGWKLRSEPVEPVLIPLLAAIGRTGSLAAAAREVGYSYRHVWNLLGKWEELLGKPLALLERGRGARLTLLASKLVELEQRARDRLQPRFLELAREFEGELSDIVESRTLRLHASHDLALARLPELADGARFALELEFHGSVESLEAFNRGDADVAGFHVAEQLQAPEISRQLRPNSHKLIGVAVREQGLILARGNPKQVHGLRDLARRDLKVVNRQRGSGTRILFDQLLAQAGVARKPIERYQMEEFTHIAVAAAVAGGIADVGFGIRAAAAHMNLGFIPLVDERYLLACHADRIESAEMKKLIALLRAKPFGKVLASLPGYDNAITGRIMEVEGGLSGPRPARNTGR
jgi:putative molybdopterin biosynthesis protein